MKENADSQGVAGIIVVGYNRFHLSVDPEFLILDAFSYAQEILVSQQDCITRLNIEDNHEHRLTAEFLQRAAGEIESWLATREGTVKSIPALARRLRLRPFQVTQETLIQYVKRLILLSDRAEEDEIPKFVFYSDTLIPMIYVQRELRLVASHTGPDVLGVVENGDEIKRRVEQVTSYSALRR